jgi:Domain of unknown function (DUF4411)
MFLFDSNTFIEAARLYYAFDLAPGFWEWLVSGPMRSQIGSVEAVREEVMSGHGDLVTWAASTPADFWRPVSESTLERASALAEWAADPGRDYKQSAVDEFLSKADFWLIAEAMASGATLVTREVSAPDSKKTIKIPDACSAFGVLCAQPFVVYSTLGLRLT